MSRNLRDVRPLTGILMGGAFFLAGTAIVFVALDWIRVDPSSIHAPRWVLGVCGAMFAFTGLLSFWQGVVNGLGGGGSGERGEQEDDFHVPSWLLGMVICTGLAVVFIWVGFGPGEREFTTSGGAGPVSVGSSDGSGTLGRWIFGAGGLLVGALAVYGWFYGLRRIVSGERGDRETG